MNGVRMTHSTYMEITVPHDDGTTRDTATSAEFASEAEGREWIARNRATFAAVGVAVTLARIDTMPAPATVERAEQDGRYFFTGEPDDCGRVLYVVGDDVVQHDFDTAGAKRARELFMVEFPNAVFVGGDL